MLTPGDDPHSAPTNAALSAPANDPRATLDDGAPAMSADTDARMIREYDNPWNRVTVLHRCLSMLHQRTYKHAQTVPCAT